ncbi:26S proteasome non-ATPase regulatory subunit 2 [Trichinella zimbabwensis]|uniref:26S proteasome non-ATPase regulatory subunit 2 n=1 Tax=Trichinella zimbabwensis TaxID=268475 RepID=A0A0V1H5X6_9BILA|nr:26S proteasome non-ATPase regulatory subunit 2 [Trichinella zimbabwensis]
MTNERVELKAANELKKTENHSFAGLEILTISRNNFRTNNCILYKQLCEATKQILVEIMTASEKFDNPVKDTVKNLKKSEQNNVPENAEQEMSEEDKKLKAELDLFVSRLQEPDQALYPAALEGLRNIIRSSTASVTSVPKPLKFMQVHYDTMKDIYWKIEDETAKEMCADIISALAMTCAKEDEKDCFKYRFLGSKNDVGSWGYEYVRHLSGELVKIWQDNDNEINQTGMEQIDALVREIVPYFLAHNGEAEACDFLMEIEQLHLLEEFCDADVHSRVCLYLTSCVPFVPDPDNIEFMECAMRLYLKFDKQVLAMRCAIVLNKIEKVKEIFLDCKDIIVQKQLAFLLARHQIFLDLPDDLPHVNDLKELMSNSNMSQYFLALARELDIMEPKVPEDIYKSNASEHTVPQIDSVRQNIGTIFVNAFINAGFCVDRMITEDAATWFYKNREHGMVSAAASQGLIYRWDVDNGLTNIDKFMYSADDNIRAGSLLAVGIVSCGVHHECDPAQALLLEFLQSDKHILRVCSTLGIGLAYANSKLESVHTTILPQLREALKVPKTPAEVTGMIGLAMGFVLVGSGDPDAAAILFQHLIEQGDSLIKEHDYRNVLLGIALIFLGRQEQAEPVVEMLRVLPKPYGSIGSTLVEVAAYAGTGNVLKIQQLLYICTERHDIAESTQKVTKEKKKDKKDMEVLRQAQGASFHQAVAVLGIALIAICEDIGSSMAFRLFSNLLRYCDQGVRHAVPVALGLLSVSNPQLNILETLSKFAHDNDLETAYSAMFALGLLGADAVQLMLVHIAQGLTHLGKGTMTLNPFHSERQLLSPSALGGLFATCFFFLDPRHTILSKQHFLLYCLVPAMNPRMLITFTPKDPNDPSSPLEQCNVNVRVGQGVDVVGQAGKPKTITGFQTYNTPILLAHGERAELATDEYIAISPILEGSVILVKNPNSEIK